MPELLNIELGDTIQEQPNTSNIEESSNIQEQQSDIQVNETINTNDNTSGDYNPIEIYNFLKDNGIAPDVENLENIKTINDLGLILNNYNQQQIANNVQNYLDGMTQQYKDFFVYLQNGGNPSQFIQNYSDDYFSIDPNNIKGDGMLQDKLLVDYYKKTTKLDDNDIKTILSKFNDDEKLNNAKKALNNLRTIQEETNKGLLQEQEEIRLKQENYMKELIGSLNKEVDDLTVLGNSQLSLKDKNEIKNLLFNNVTYNKLTSNFDKYRLNLVLLDKLGLLDNPNKLIEVMNKKTENKYNFKSTNNNGKNNEEITIDLIQNNDKKEGKKSFPFIL